MDYPDSKVALDQPYSDLPMSVNIMDGFVFIYKELMHDQPRRSNKEQRLYELMKEHWDGIINHNPLDYIFNNLRAFMLKTIYALSAFIVIVVSAVIFNLIATIKKINVGVMHVLRYALQPEQLRNMSSYMSLIGEE